MYLWSKRLGGRLQDSGDDLFSIASQDSSNSGTGAFASGAILSGWMGHSVLICKAADLFILDATSSRRGSVAFESGGFCSTWLSEGHPLVSFGPSVHG